MTVSVAVDDPGGWADSFCELMAKVTRDHILLTDAIFWDKKTIPNLTTRRIKDDIAKLHNHFKFDYHLCETNNQGHMIISDLKSEYHIPIIGITTSANLKNPKTIRRGTSLDKNKAVPYVQKFIEDGTIQLPKTMTPGLKLGIEQIQNYGVSKAGKYKALSGHDDFISCLVTLVHWAKARILKGIASNLPLGLVSESPNTTQSPNQFMRNIQDRMQSAGMSSAEINIDESSY